MIQECISLEKQISFDMQLQLDLIGQPEAWIMSSCVVVLDTVSAGKPTPKTSHEAAVAHR